MNRGAGINLHLGCFIAVPQILVSHKYLKMMGEITPLSPGGRERQLSANMYRPQSLPKNVVLIGFCKDNTRPSSLKDERVISDNYLMLLTSSTTAVWTSAAVFMLISVQA